MIPLPSLVPMLIAAAALAAGAAGGYTLAVKIGAGKTAQAREALARCEAGRAQDARAAAENATRLLARAQEAEGQAAARLAAARAESDRKLKETRREVYRLSTGRECLSGPLRLRLNGALAAADDDLPQGARHVDPADAAAADDTAVAQWILDAARQYDDCRARLDAIRHWDEVTHGR